ncbi:thymidine phosphorylase [Nereida sp. MMG025]|uniref:thymidine phosphorylase n=1 Tax=Nereida sp. MMG025 TaxID=2909981 RepID=UPI00351D76FE|nr:thymidine phosphorylase [Nereida sp. MMG025]
MSAFGPILDRYRHGHVPTGKELISIVNGLTDGNLTDAQAGAFAMAVCIYGLDAPAALTLTTAMRDSGKVLDWQLDAPVVDKHSTGGVGDCTSFLIAPALAACGAYVPMISGRGLGHTGGTLDKLEAIPGVCTQMPEAKFRRIVGEVGCAIVSATDEIAPADKRLYGVRDVTGTVTSNALITASILSKKLAAGLDGLVLDIKLGNGAFMKTMEQAEALAASLVDTANGAGCKTTALITDMNQPLAKSIGNALEISEAMHALTGDGVDHDLPDLAGALGGEVLAGAGLADDPDSAADQITDTFYNGDAAEVFGRMIAAMGGPRDFVDRWEDRLPSAPVMREIRPKHAGYVTQIAADTLGQLVVELGGGRKQARDRIDPSVGLSDIAALGDFVDADVPLLMLHARSEADADAAQAVIQQAFGLGEEPPQLPPTVYKRVT